MASAKFYHISLIPKDGVNSIAVEKKINLALDWIKYSETSWLVYSTSDVATWMTRLKPLAEPDGRLFICELNVKNRNGWMNKNFWEWLKKER
jgi:hypothetical protein